MNDKIWIKDFDVLLRDDRLNVFFPREYMSDSEKVNAICRFSIYIGLLLFLLKNDISYIYIPVIVFTIVYFLYILNTKNEEVQKVDDTDIQYDKTINSFRNPTEKNPFMNLNILDYGKKITKPALKGRRGKKKLREKIDKVFGDVDKMYNREMSSRAFYTMPVTTIPNDRNKFAKWCYKQKNRRKEKGLMENARI